ncbi:porphobilinogen deaminase [Lithohypha guttulata]|uniref:hydroxymethylbilane synthase n=1 Tax=Lithohypha guttulata TaxID=1690604 RepID=A0AAN7Y6L3_9EURO|nr:porphobilinogen deaminase [Lithohypha guttulata]
MSTISVAAGAEAPHPEDAARSEHTYNVGTRKSKLALKQTELVLTETVKAFPKYVFAVKAKDTAAGDIDKVTPFKDMPVKNIWTHELETLMVEGDLDFLVHSLKDVPTQLPSNCEIGATLAREDPRDAFVIKAGRDHCRIQDLPSGSVVGTSSIRRTAQIAMVYPHLVVKDLRGNIGTRLNKLDAEDSPFDAIILAAAGLIRIDLSHRISQFLDSKNGNMLHAVGQGAIGIENRSDDSKVKEIITKINHLPTFYSTIAERSLLRTIEGGCSAPLGIETTWIGHDRLQLKAVVISLNGKEFAEVEMVEQVTNVQEAEEMGQTGATEILQRGADRILAEIEAKRPTTVTDLEET